MKRWLFNLLAGVSLLFATTASVFWVRSYWFEDTIWFWHLGQPGTVMSLYGKIATQVMIVTPHRSGGIDEFKFGGRRIPGAGADDEAYSTGRFRWPQQIPSDAMHAGFAFVHLQAKDSTSGVPTRDDEYWAVVPYWSLVLILLLPTLLAMPFLLNSRCRRKHEKIGVCAACGYDLRATPDRCPECGAVARGRAEG